MQWRCKTEKENVLNIQKKTKDKYTQKIHDLTGRQTLKYRFIQLETYRRDNYTPVRTLMPREKKDTYLKRTCNPKTIQKKKVKPCR